MNDPNTEHSHIEWGVHWVYPDGDEYYIVFGPHPADRERAVQAVEDFPGRTGSRVVQRTITHSRWTAADTGRALLATWDEQHGKAEA